MKISLRGAKRSFQNITRNIGQKLRSVDWNTVGRKAKNTVRDVAHGIQEGAGYVAPVASAVAAGATLAGQPEIAAPAAALAAAAHTIKHK